MKIIGIETSTDDTRVALVERGSPGEVFRAVIPELVELSPRRHSERLLAMIHEGLGRAGWSLHDVDGFAVSLGPGSFTGLRVGLALVKGLALATQKPVVGVSTLHVLAAQVPTPSLLARAAGPDLHATAAQQSVVVCPIIDAKRGELFAAMYRSHEGGAEELVSPWRGDPRSVTDRLQSMGLSPLFTGLGLHRHGEALRHDMRSREGPPTKLARPLAELGDPGSRGAAAGGARGRLREGPSPELAGGARGLDRFNRWSPEGHCADADHWAPSATMVARLGAGRLHIGEGDNLAALAPTYLQDPPIRPRARPIGSSPGG